MSDTLLETVAWLKKKGVINPEIGIILGTGLHQLAAEIETELEFSYEEIPHFPVSTVEFHSGKLRYGKIKNKKVLAMQGRFHFYEGYSFAQVGFPVRVMKLLGINTLLLSNAAGSVNLNWQKGELMLLDDHMNLQNGNPLIGKNMDDLGPRFPDMGAPYDQSLQKKLLHIAKAKNIVLHRGVYASVTGPMLETRAEYRYLKKIGVDAVGMSTVPEILVAHHMGMQCAAVSVLTDECDPENLKPVDIAEIIAVAATADDDLANLYRSLIESL